MRGERFAPALRGQVTVSLLFGHISRFIPLRIVLISVLDSPDDPEWEKGIICMHEIFDDHHHPQTIM